MSAQGINQNQPPTREECERDESTQRPFIWNPSADQLAEYAANDPWNTESRKEATMTEHLAHEINRKVDAVLSVGLPLTNNQIADTLIKHLKCCNNGWEHGKTT